MNTSSFWFEQSGPGPDPGSPIGQSLRFRGGQRLIGTPVTVPAGDFTLSFWLKRGDDNSETGMMSLFIGSPNYGFQLGNSNQTPPWAMFTRISGAAQISNGPLTDYSAWYHCVFSTTGGNTTFYLNGETQLTTASPASANTVLIGSNAEASQDDALRAYLADYYCIDGQALLPTAFGRYNDDGVWVPREVDFTPAEMRWSDFLTATVGTIDGSNPGLATNAFDGDFDSNTGRCFTSAGGELTWAPPVDTPATFTTTLEIYNTNSAGNQTITWNGNTVDPTGGWVTVFTDPDPDPANPNVIDANQPLVITALNTASRGELNAVRLDGEIVLNPFIWSGMLFSDNVNSADPDDIDFDSTAQSWSSNTPPTGFNGSTANFVQTNGTWIFRPNPPIENATLVEVFQTNSSTAQQLFFNSANVGRTDYVGSTWTEVYNGEATTINNIAGSFLPSGGCGFAGIRVNGQVLIDGVNNSYGANGFRLQFADPDNLGLDTSGNLNNFTATGFETTDTTSPDYDLMQDSPTQNYATLNPLYTNGDTGPGTLSDGNLGYTAYTAPGYKVCPGTQSLKDGAYYWEYTAGNVNNSYPGQVGILRGTNPALTTRIGWDTNNNVFGFSLQYNGQVTGDAFGEGTSTEEILTFLSDGYVQGDVIGMYCDIPNNYLAWYKNGALFYEITNVNSEYDWMPALNQFYNYAFNSINFGQIPFIYPLPAGYQALQTQKLPAATIANGRDNFQALTGPGQGSVTSEITAVEVPNEVLVTYNGNSTWTGPTDPSMTGLRAVVGSGSGASGFNTQYGGCSDGGSGQRYESFFSTTELGTSVPITVGVGGVYVNDQGSCNNNTVGGFSRITVDGGTQWEVPGSPGGYPCNSASGSGSNAAKRGSLKGFVTADNVTSDYPAITGGTACASQPGKTGQVLFYELYPEGSGIGTPSTDGIILTFADSTNFADFAKNQSCQNEDGSATGVIASIDAVNSTIILKDTTGTWQVGDSLYTTSGSGSGLLGVAQQAFPNGLWWIKDMVNANQHQLVDSVRGGNLALQCPNDSPETAYVAPAGDSVAWCWNYNSSDPTVNGFEIIDPFEVTALQMTVPHNLGAAPEFIISKFIDSAVVWRTWHKDLNAGNTLFLSKSDAQTASACRVDNVTSTDFEWNSLQSSVDDNQNVINYAWTSVPGYSAFGSYTGNSSTDGPFIYTGMKPAWLLVKRVNTADHWAVYDSTRSPTNPAILQLYPDTTSSENGQATNNAIDLLSNGFKFRTSDSRLNANETYIYAAFAENPFGGSNVSPVTAR